MKLDEFVSKLTTRYPGLKEKTYQLQDIKDNLAFVQESTIDQLWHAFNGNYDRDTPPRWASINIAAQKAGLSLGSALAIKHWVFQCDYCGSYFGGSTRDENGQKCTGCKKIKPSTIVILEREENPFNMNKRKFDNIAGNTLPVPETEPHRLSLDFPKWVRDHEEKKPMEPIQARHSAPKPVEQEKPQEQFEDLF